MNIKDRIAEHRENLEKIGFVLVFLFALLLIFSSGGVLLFASLNIAGLLMLLFVYMLSGKNNLIKAILLLMLSYPVARFGALTSLYATLYIEYILYGTLIIYGLYILTDSIRRSFANSNFELLAFLMGIFILIAPLAILFGNKVMENAGQYYFYALAFILATIMYNDNLWLRYEVNNRSMIKYLFVIALLAIMDSSLTSIM